MGALEINRLFSRYFLEKARPKTDFFKQDWDNLIILDACRYDLMEEVGYRSEDLEWRWSDGSNSEEFVRYSVRNGPLDDVVWVTANPWVNKFEDSIFEVVPLWDEEWDEDFETVQPERVVQRGLEALERFPDKRLVLHFMQPHYPFIGTSDARLPDHTTFTGDGIRADKSDALTVWEQLQEGIVTKTAVWDAYRANLEYVLPVVDDFVDRVSGKTVITSDHGNALGSRAVPIPLGLYGHPRGLRSKVLAKVPWIEIPTDERRNINPGKLRTSSTKNDASTERLRSLGYLN